jgi:hypothetical protein
VTIDVALALAAVASSACGLLGLWLRLRFLRHVYDKGGAKDLRVAANALRGAFRDLVSGIGRRVRTQKTITPRDDQAAS